jgi:hypothetical protein
MATMWLQCDDGSLFDVGSAVAVETRHVDKSEDFLDPSVIIPEHWVVSAKIDHGNPAADVRPHHKRIMNFDTKELAEEFVEFIFRGLVNVP